MRETACVVSRMRFRASLQALAGEVLKIFAAIGPTDPLDRLRRRPDALKRRACLSRQPLPSGLLTRPFTG